MTNCCVPFCLAGARLHAVPYTSLRWKQWLKLCPFLFKYTYQQLEYVKICRDHFIPDHIDYETGRLKKNAIPLLNLSTCHIACCNSRNKLLVTSENKWRIICEKHSSLPHINEQGRLADPSFHSKPSQHNKENNALEGNKILEVGPIQHNEPVNVKVCALTTGLLSQTENTNIKYPFSEGETEMRQATYPVFLKAEDRHGHNLYCLPSRADERSACLSAAYVMCQMSSKERLLNDCSIVSIEAGQQHGTCVDPNMYSGTPLPDITAGCIPAVYDQHTAKPFYLNVKYNMKTAPVAQETEDAQLRTRIPLMNTITDAAPCPPVLVSPISVLHPSVVSNKDNSTSKEQKLYEQNKMLKIKLKSINRKCKKLKSKLNGIRAIAKPYLKAIPYLTGKAKALIDTQVRLAGVKPKAARYNQEEKLFALKLHQISPDCYRYLQKYLKLPTMNTVQAIMNNV